MGFQVFEAYGAASRPEATLRASGYLFLSKGILKRGGMEGATHAQLMFDEETDKLGVSLYMDPTGENDTIRELSREKSGASINIVAVLRYYRFPDMKKIGKRVLSVDFDEDFVGDKIITIDLSSLRETATASPPQQEEEEDIAF